MKELESYFAVIFSSRQTGTDSEGYTAMANRMEELARLQKGFLGIETVRQADGHGISVSYWETEEDILNWKQHAEHQLAQKLGREKWYRQYSLRIAKVQREYHFTGS